MSFDVLLIIAALAAVVASVVVVLMCRSFAAESAFCPARFWSRRPAWHQAAAARPEVRR